MARPNTSPTGGIGWRNLRTGILFVGGIVLMMVLGLIIGKNTNLLTGKRTAYIFVPDIKGLTEGNLVSISGKKVGTVENMRFTTQNDTQGVVVELNIRSEYFGLISEDSRAMIKSLGVLGDKYIDIAVGRSAGYLVDGGFLNAGVDPGVEELTASALKTMNTIEEVTGRINRGEGTIGKLVSSSELSDRILKTVNNIEVMTEKLATGKGLAGKLVNDEALAARFTSIVANLTSLTDSIKNGRGTLGKLIVDDQLYNNLAALTRQSDSLLLQLSNPEGTFGRLAHDPLFYDNLNRTVISLDSLLIDLKENPGRYVRLSLF